MTYLLLLAVLLQDNTRFNNNIPYHTKMRGYYNIDIQYMYDTTIAVFQIHVYIRFNI